MVALRDNSLNGKLRAQYAQILQSLYIGQPDRNAKLTAWIYPRAVYEEKSRLGPGSSLSQEPQIDEDLGPGSLWGQVIDLLEGATVKSTARGNRRWSSLAVSASVRRQSSLKKKMARVRKEEEKEKEKGKKD